MKSAKLASDCIIRKLMKDPQIGFNRIPLSIKEIVDDIDRVYDKKLSNSSINKTIKNLSGEFFLDHDGQERKKIKNFFVNDVTFLGTSNDFIKIDFDANHFMELRKYLNPEDIYSIKSDTNNEFNFVKNLFTEILKDPSDIVKGNILSRYVTSNSDLDFVCVGDIKHVGLDSVENFSAVLDEFSAVCLKNSAVYPDFSAVSKNTHENSAVLSIFSAVYPNLRNFEPKLRKKLVFIMYNIYSITRVRNVTYSIHKSNNHAKDEVKVAEKETASMSEKKAIAQPSLVCHGGSENVMERTILMDPPVLREVKMKRDSSEKIINQSLDEYQLLKDKPEVNDLFEGTKPKQDWEENKVESRTRKKSRNNPKDVPLSAFKTNHWIQYTKQEYKRVAGKVYTGHKTEMTHLKNKIYPRVFKKLNMSARDFKAFIDMKVKQAKDVESYKFCLAFINDETFDEVEVFNKQRIDMRRNDIFEHHVYLPHRPVSSFDDDIEKMLEEFADRPIALMYNYGIPVYHRYLQKAEDMTLKEATDHIWDVIQKTLKDIEQDDKTCVKKICSGIAQASAMWMPYNTKNPKERVIVDWEEEFKPLWEGLHIDKEAWWKNRGKFKSKPQLPSMKNFFEIKKRRYGRN